MDVFLQLATYLAEAEGGGFGLNFDILETNLINLSIVIALVVYFGRGFLGKILGERKSSIETALKEIEQRKQKAAAALADQQQKLAQAQAQAQQIRDSAAAAAEKTRAEILARAEQDVARMREVAAQDLSADQERVINELRQRVAALALERASGALPERLDEGTQQKLIDRSIALLGGS